MTDSSKINSNNDFGANKAGSSSAAKANSNLPNSGYKNSANSQSELVLNEIKKNNSENGKQLDYEIRHSNPILYEALKDANKKLPEKNKEKKAPPEPSLRVKLAPKGYAINPKKVKPTIPGRLNPFNDPGISNKDRLTLSLGDSSDANLNKLYGEKLMQDYIKSFQSNCIAELLDIDSGIFNQDRQTIIDYLEIKAELLAEDQYLYEFMQSILQSFTKTDNPLIQILQLYLPFPLPYTLKDIDARFNADEEEFYEDLTDKEDSDDDDEAENPEQAYDEISLSILTLNYNKIHILLRFLRKSKELRVFIRGDLKSSELSIPIEMAIDDCLFGELDNIEFENFLWKTPVPLEIKDRVLKINSKGKLNANMILVIKAILDIIAFNDLIDDKDSNIL